MPPIINRLYRETLKRVPGVDHSPVMHWIKHQYDMILTRAHWASEWREQRRFIANYAFSPEQRQTFALMLERLGIAKSEQLLPLITRRMLFSDFNNLLALLDFFIKHPFDGLRDRPAELVTTIGDFHPHAGVTTHPRNILFITGEFPSPMHGGGGRVIDFIKIMSREHKIYLYSWFDGNESPAAYRDLQPSCQKLERVHFQDFEGDLERVKRFIGDVSMDVVHYEWPRSLKNFNRAWGRFHIFTYMEAVSLSLQMELAVQKSFTPRWYQTFVNLLRALFVEIVEAAKADFHIVVTRKDGEFLSQFVPGRRFAILNHGVNPQEFCLPDRTPDDNTLVFIGNYRHYPNEQAVKFFFEKIFPSIQAHIPDLRVYLVGAHPSSHVKRYHDNRHVFVTGSVNDFRPYIQRASVCIAPLVSGAGIRTKVIQYAALKRVCVATSIAATDLVFEDGKDILIADDPAVFAQRVVFLLQNPHVARQMAESAYEKARSHYDNQALVQNLYGVYDYLEMIAGQS